MRDTDKLLRVIRQAATQTVAAGIPCDLCFGKVLNMKPVRILVNGQTVIPADLVVWLNDAKTAVTIGATVAMIRRAGGQQFLVLGVTA